MKMKLLLVSQNMRIYNPTALTESFYRGFRDNGVDVHKYDLSYYNSNVYISYLIKRVVPLRKLLLERSNEELVAFIRRSDFTHVFFLKGTFVLPQTILELKKYNIHCSCFNPDDPFNKSTWGGSQHSNILDSVQHYNDYFIWSRSLVGKIKNNYEIPTHYFPFAIDEKLIKRFTGLKRSYDVSFIGNSDTERQKWINGIADQIDANSLIKKVDVFGMYWKKHNKVSLNGGKFGEDYFKVFYQSKININILRQQNKGDTNMRTFEIPATNNFMMHESSVEAESFFKPDVDAVYFSSVEEFLDKSNYYLKNETLREKIALSGYNRSIKDGYTYTERIKSIIKILNQN